MSSVTLFSLWSVCSLHSRQQYKSQKRIFIIPVGTSQSWALIPPSRCFRSSRLHRRSHSSARAYNKPWWGMTRWRLQRRRTCHKSANKSPNVLHSSLDAPRMHITTHLWVWYATCSIVMKRNTMFLLLILTSNHSANSLKLARSAYLDIVHDFPVMASEIRERSASCLVLIGNWQPNLMVNVGLKSERAAHPILSDWNLRLDPRDL